MANQDAQLVNTEPTQNKVVHVGEVDVSSPMMQLISATQQGISLDAIERAMDLQERWEAGQARKAYVSAMAKFKSSIPDILKTKQADYGAGKAKYSFASLDDVVDAVTGSLSENGLSHHWDTSQEAGLITVSCVMTHELGHSEKVSLSATADNTGGKNNIQAIASTISYLQRYTLLAITGAATKDQDDDGNSSSKLLPPVMPTMRDSQFEKGMPNWIKAVQEGRRTPRDIVANLSKSLTLTNDQKSQIMSIQAQTQQEWDAEYDSALESQNANIQL